MALRKKMVISWPSMKNLIPLSFLPLLKLLSFFSSVIYFSHRRSARIQKLSRLHQPYLGTIAVVFDFADGAALQVVSQCPWPRKAGILPIFCSVAMCTMKIDEFRKHPFVIYVCVF